MPVYVTAVRSRKIEKKRRLKLCRDRVSCSVSINTDWAARETWRRSAAQGYTHHRPQTHCVSNTERTWRTLIQWCRHSPESLRISLLNAHAKSKMTTQYYWMCWHQLCDRTQTSLECSILYITDNKWSAFWVENESKSTNNLLKKWLSIHLLLLILIIL